MLPKMFDNDHLIIPKNIRMRSVTFKHINYIKTTTTMPHHYYKISQDMILSLWILADRRPNIYFTQIYKRAYFKLVHYAQTHHPLAGKQHCKLCSGLQSQPVHNLIPHHPHPHQPSIKQMYTHTNTHTTHHKHSGQIML